MISNLKNKKFIWPLIFAFLMLISLVWSLNSHSREDSAKDSQLLVQAHFISQEMKAQSTIKSIKYKLDGLSVDKVLQVKTKLFEQSFPQGIECLLYLNDSLIFWSSSEAAFPSNKKDIGGDDARLIYFGNAFYYLLHESVGQFDIYGLIKIKHRYALNNHLLVNEFESSYVLDPNIEVNSMDDGVPIHIQNGEYAFSLKDTFKSSNNNELSAVLFFLFVLSCLNLMYTLLYRLFIEHKKSGYFFLVTCLVLLLLYGLTLKLSFLRSIYMFSPSLFASSDFLPSLGHLLLLSILVFFGSYTYFKLGVRNFIKHPPVQYSKYILIGIYVLMNLFTARIFRSLIFNSNISFVAYRANEVSEYTFIGLLVLSLLIAASIILLFMTARKVKQDRTKGFMWLVVVLVFFHVFNFVLNKEVYPYAVLFGITCFWLLVFLNKHSWMLNLSKVFILTGWVSIYGVAVVISESDKKEQTRMELLAEALSNEQDFQTEVLLMPMSEKISNDTFLVNYFILQNKEVRLLEDYIDQQYLKNYLSKYKVKVGQCDNEGALVVKPELTNQCLEYYERILDLSDPVVNSTFYYHKDVNGQIEYIGQIPIKINDSALFMFLELNLKDRSDNLGYPELLMNKRAKQLPYEDAFSYGRYYQRNLISQYGKYAYAAKLDPYDLSDSSSFFAHDGFEHTVFRQDAYETILISHPKRSWMDIVFTFSYLYMFFALAVFVFVILYRRKMFFGGLTLRNKIQYSMIAILLLSFVLIGGITIYLSVSQYEKRQKQFISEKIKSVAIELEHKLNSEQKLTKNWQTPKYSNLEALLKKFSQVFYTDINLYAPNGKLIASSRPEIFDLRLTSDMMQPGAFYQMHEKNSTEYINNERIGRLNYLSGYYPFYNGDRELLAYLNLPYFTKQKAFTQELTTLLIAIINIYVLLFLLTSVMAFVVSEQLTRPMALIQASFKQVKLGVKNTLIEYNRNDEIKELVNEYNRMMMELTASADKLAKSEREVAWREMAKQIAHEIKNPLTPMKLNIQQLERSWNPDDPNWQDKMKKVTHVLVEQIDSLSAIASEFSNFAKISDYEVDDVELLQKVKSVVSLFGNSQNAKITVRHEGIKSVAIKANQEQILRVFNNVIKNSIQAIPSGQDGKVNIAFEIVNKGVIRVIIEDNGKGIDLDTSEKLFQPNFTTKSSGTGLGLAIVQKIINNTHGQVSFDLSFENGAKLVIEWPVSDVILG